MYYSKGIFTVELFGGYDQFEKNLTDNGFDFSKEHFMSNFWGYRYSIPKQYQPKGKRLTIFETSRLIESFFK